MISLRPYQQDLGSQSPYGAMWFATDGSWFARRPNFIGRNPLTGLCGLQPARGLVGNVGRLLVSQSPYGAMWFATVALELVKLAGFIAVAIPLRGYVVCNLSSHTSLLLRPVPRVAIPLRGYVVCNASRRAAQV